MAEPPDLLVLRQHSLWLSRLTLFLFGATTAVIVLPTLAGFGAAAGGEPPLIPNILAAAVIWLPSFFYLYALWSIRSAFRDFSAGRFFGAAVASGCTRAGLALALGATLSAAGVPNLLRVFRAHGLVEVGPQGLTGILQFDTAYLAVGVVGLALLLLGRLLRHAEEIQKEAAGLRDELGGFM